MAGPKVSDYLLERLRAWGVEKVFAYPGDGINGLLAAWGRADDQPAVRPGPARGDGRVRGGRLREVHRPGRRVRGDLGPGRDPPAQRAVRRQARPRAGGGDRRADQPVGDGRLLPAGSRPAQPVQGRGQRVRADGDRARAAAQRAGPGDPDGAGRAGPDRDHHPVRRAGAGVLRARRTRSRWCPPAWASTGPHGRPTTRRSRRAAEMLNAGEKVAILVGQGARGARAELEQVAELLGAGVAKAAAGQGRAVRRAALRDRRRSGCSAPGPATR